MMMIRKRRKIKKRKRGKEKKKMRKRRKKIHKLLQYVSNIKAYPSWQLQKFE